MSVKQLSIFLENRPGRLETVAQLLGDANISILALSVADTKDFGILRLLVDTRQSGPHFGPLQGGQRERGIHVHDGGADRRASDHDLPFRRRQAGA